MKKVLILIMVLFNLLAPMAYGEENLAKQLETKYFTILDDWVSRGGPTNEIQSTVVQTCGKLVMLSANTSEKTAFMTTEREEFDFRVDVCTKMTVHQIYAQPEFEKKEIVSMICKESKVTLFHKLCEHFGVR